MNGPICTELDVFDKSPGLNASTCQSGDTVIAPPGGDRKWCPKWKPMKIQRLFDRDELDNKAAAAHIMSGVRG